MPPQTNIVCFRHMLKGFAGKALDSHQEELRRRLVENGEFHLTQVRLGDQVWLRTTVMNPMTTEMDLQQLLRYFVSNASNSSTATGLLK
jgi:L-2,4-diaminobutyrate decarboxylase